MGWLNYHHLHYFWAVAQEGSIKAASKRLRLSQPTISAQIKLLEDSLGDRLFKRVGRRLELTETGKVALRYADEIFSLGTEMQEAIARGAMIKTPKLVVGVSDLVPKLILYQLIAPALHMRDAVQVVCREDKTERLLAELSTFALDLVIAEAPLAGQASVRAFNHPLGESSVSFFGTAELVRRFKKGFPRSLDGAPILVPTANTLLRRSLEHWFTEIGVRPQITAEFEDSALLKAFGSEGAGLFPGPTAIRRDIADMYGTPVLGQAGSVTERFYAISVERKITHPAVRVISDMARRRLFHSKA
ncbi:MAG: transcriptional activator NhaR [Sandaracinaceae bacterium]